MIPKEEIIKQINRFYDLLEKKKNKIEEDISNRKANQENHGIYFDYFKLTSQIGTEMQYAIGNLKDELDMMESSMEASVSITPKESVPLPSLDHQQTLDLLKQTWIVMESLTRSVVIDPFDNVKMLSWTREMLNHHHTVQNNINSLKSVTKTLLDNGVMGIWNTTDEDISFLLTEEIEEKIGHRGSSRMQAIQGHLMCIIDKITQKKNKNI